MDYVNISGFAEIIALIVMFIAGYFCGRNYTSEKFIHDYIDEEWIHDQIYGEDEEEFENED